MEKVYNKLVRDLIPEIIKADNCTPVVRVLNDKDYKIELEKKLLEEYKEVLQTTTSEERLEELADMLEIIQYLALIEGKSFENIVEKAKAKKLKRGGFDNKLYLEKIVNNNNK